MPGALEDEDPVEDILRNMAAYHGTWWEAPELAVLTSPTDHYNNVSRFLDFEGRCAVGMERAKSVIPKRLYGQADRLWEGTQKGLEIATDVLPRTLLHGDSHAGQTYITGDGRMGLTDWQATLQGGWSYDFAYFVGSACEQQDRRAWDKELLELYLEALDAAGGKAPPFDEAWLRYRQSLFYPYSAWAFTIGTAALDGELVAGAPLSGQLRAALEAAGASARGLSARAPGGSGRQGETPSSIMRPIVSNFARSRRLSTTA